MEDKSSVAIEVIDSNALAKIEEKKSKSIKLPVPDAGKAAIFADALVPAVVDGLNAAKQFDMAIVKFPDGVGWADLCERRRDGWKLLSNFREDGKFNEMAAIKQAGLQPEAVANIALQGAAVAVGMAYMNEINNQLKTIESGISEIKALMEREQKAKMLASYEMLKRYAERFDEYIVSPEKKTAALIGIHNALQDATNIWFFQLESIAALKEEVASRKSMDYEEITEAADKLHELEARTGQAFQLVAAVGLLGMQYDNDFSEKRILREMDDLKKLAVDFAHARGGAYAALGTKATNLKGLPLAIAEPDFDDVKGNNPLEHVANFIGGNAARVNPIRMAATAKVELEKKKSELIDYIASDNVVKEINEKRSNQLDDMNFMFNKADTMVLEDGAIRLLESGE